MSKCTCLAHGIWTDPDGICHECGEPAAKRPYTCDTIRLWIYWRDGVVKISVPFGESVSIGYGGPTDEGWSRYTETFEYDPDTDTITRTVVSDGCDCDGRLTHVTESEWKRGGDMAPMYEFADDGEMIELDGLQQPDWQIAGRCQRDYAAEAAGY